MIYRLIFISIIASMTSCESPASNRHFKNAEELPSPFSTNTLYRFTIEGVMAFTSDIVAINILSNDEKIKSLGNDYYTFKDFGYPFSIKWIDKDTILVRCLTQIDRLKEKQPFENELVKWKNWTFKIEYYSMFSTTLGGVYQFDSISVNSNSIRFYSPNEDWTFNENNIQITLDSSKLNLTYFRIDTFDNGLGLSMTSYRFYSKYNDYKLGKFQPLIKCY